MPHAMVMISAVAELDSHTPSTAMPTPGQQACRHRGSSAVRARTRELRATTVQKKPNWFLSTNMPL